MILDLQTRLSDAQAFSATGYTTNTYDSGAAGNAIDVGEPLCLVWTVEVAADAVTGDETYQFQAVQSANADLTAHDVLQQSDTAFVTRATLTAGAKLIQHLSGKTKRYLGGRLVLAGTTPSITVTCVALPLSMVQNDKLYADALTISS